MTQIGMQLLLTPLMWFFLLAGVCGVAIGLGLIFCSGRMLTLFEKSNRWISFRRVLKPVAIQRDSWPFVEKHRRALGLVLLIVSIFTIFNLTVDLDLEQISRRLTMGHVAAQIVVLSVWWFFLIGSVAAVITGIMLLFFPGVVHKIEQQSGRWYSSRHLSRNMDTMHTPLDSLALTYPRELGAAVVVLSLANIVLVCWRL
jgi:hypothetical protein